MTAALGWVRIFVRLQLVRLRVQLEYEVDFWLGIAGVLLTQLANLTFIWVLFSQIPSLVGWSLWEAALLFALLTIPRGLVDLFFDGVWQLPWYVHHGHLDRMYIRPVPLLLQVFAVSSRLHGLGHLVLGGALLVGATVHLGLTWTPTSVLLTIGFILNATLLITSIVVAGACSAFWERSGDNAFAVFLTYLSDSVQVPISVYGAPVQFLLTWILPFAFVSYYPACVLLGKPVDPSWLPWLIPASGPVVALAAGALWRHGVGRYESTGH